MAGPIRISILANAAQANRALADSESRFSKWGKRAGAAIAGAGIAIGAGAALLATNAIKHASDAQQSLGATETVFGKYADTVIKRSNDAAMALGLSANEYRELSNVLGAGLAGAGIPIKEVAGLTDDLTKRAADLAATFGGPTSDAVAAIGSLMRGEADPIEAYGVSIKQSDVAARLAAQGLSGLTGEAKKQAEMQARVDLLMEKTSGSMGAFAKESNTLAGQQQRLGAVWEDLQAKIGTALLPVLTKLAAAAIAALHWLEQYGPAARAIVRELGDRLGPVVRAVGRWLVDLGGTIKTNALPVLATMADTFRNDVVPALRNAYEYLSTRLVPIFVSVAGVVKSQVLPGISAVAQFVYGTLYPALVNLAGIMAEKVKPVFETLVDVFRSQVMPAIQELMAKWRELWPVIQPLVVVIAAIIGGFVLFQLTLASKVLPIVIRVAAFFAGTFFKASMTVVSVVQSIIKKVIEFGTTLVGGVKKVGEFASGAVAKFGEVINWVKSLPGRVLNALGGVGSTLKNKGREILQGFWSGATEKFESIRTWAAGIPNKVKTTIGDLGRTLFNIGKSIIDGLLDGMKAAWDSASSWLSSRASEIVSLKGPPKKDAVLLVNNGRLIMGGLEKGMRLGYRGVSRYLGDVTQEIAATRFEAPSLSDLTRGSDWNSILTTRNEETMRIEMRLTAQEIDQLSRGRQISSDLDAYKRAGGRVVTA